MFKQYTITDILFEHPGYMQTQFEYMFVLYFIKQTQNRFKSEIEKNPQKSLKSIKLIVSKGYMSPDMHAVFT